MIAFIDDQRAVHGVEPICKVLPIAPSTYHAHEVQRRDPMRLSARARRNLALRIEVRRVFDANYRAYSVRTVWRQLQREGFDVERCTVARLMRAMGLGKGGRMHMFLICSHCRKMHDRMLCVMKRRDPIIPNSAVRDVYWCRDIPADINHKSPDHNVRAI